MTSIIQKLTTLIKSSFLKDMMSMSGGVAVSQALMLASIGIISRLYDPQAFGIFAFYNACALMAAVIVSGKSESLIPTFKHRFEALNIMSVVLTFSLAITAITLLLIGAYQLGWDNSGFNLTYYIAPLLALVLILNAVIIQYAIRRRRYKNIGIASVVRSSSIIGTTILFGLSFNQLGMAPHNGLILGLLLGNLISVLFMFRILSKKDITYLWNKPKSQCLETFKKDRKLFSSVAASQIIATAQNNMPIFTITYNFNAALAGIFSMSERLAYTPVVLVATALGDVYRERASRQFHKTGEFLAILTSSVKLTLALSLIPFAIAIYFAEPLIILFLGQNWVEAVPVVQWMLFGQLFAFNQFPFDKTPYIVGAHRYILFWQIIRFALEILGFVIVYFGYLTFIQYVIFRVVVRILMALYDLYRSFRFAAGKDAVAQ